MKLKKMCDYDLTAVIYCGKCLIAYAGCKKIQIMLKMLMVLNSVMAVPDSPGQGHMIKMWCYWDIKTLMLCGHASMIWVILFGVIYGH